MENLDQPPSRPPPPPPTKKLSRPKITLQIPDATTPGIQRAPVTAQSVYWGPTSYHAKGATTAGTHTTDPNNPYFNPFLHMYHNKASEFMFKQFAGFKDFTMNTAKSGLSAGEKTAFWVYNKLSVWSRKWFTHLFLSICLLLYSIMGAAIFMALEGPNEDVYDKNLTDIRQDIAIWIKQVSENDTLTKLDNTQFLSAIEESLIQYEVDYTECVKHINNNNTKKKTWTFWNAMFYAGTIYTTIEIVGMSEEQSGERKTLSLNIPKIKAETETQTEGHLVSRSPDTSKTMEMEQNQGMSIRKRRNLSKNRGQNTRQREKTPEPGRTPVPHEDTTTSDEEAAPPVRNSREVEADSTYEEMRRLVLEKCNVKDPVYDIDMDEILEKRAMAANERRRRSISPFALMDKEELCKLERKGSFIDPSNKLLSTSYNLSPKDENPVRRHSLTIETPRELQTPTSSTSTSPKDKEFPYPLPSTPKKLEEMVYPDEVEAKKQDQVKKTKTPVKVDNVFTFDDNKELVPPTPTVRATTPKPVETPATPGELVTKVIQIERTPSRTLPQDKKPVVEVRERIVRTPSRKLSADIKPILAKPQPSKTQNQEPQSKMPPVKPARSKSATRFLTKTSESEMSEDQINQQNMSAAGSKKRFIPIPRRFMKNRSPRANRSQSVNRLEDVKVIDKTGTTMTDTSREIIELMQQARARSLSIPKDDPRLPVQYKDYTKKLQTPKRTPSVTPRATRGISCPKTIQIIPNREILKGLTPAPKHPPPPPKQLNDEHNKHSRQSSGYIDASQSEYTSSCYSTTPSENEYDFNLSERTAELTRKLNLLSQEVDETIHQRESLNKRSKHELERKKEEDPKSGLRKRSTGKAKNGVKEIDGQKEIIESKEEIKPKPVTKSRFKLFSNWYEFKTDHKTEYDSIKLLRNKCICELIIIIAFCGLGGMMFRTLEGSFENAFKCSTRNVKRDFIESLWRGSHHLREEDWKSMARKKLYEFENQLHTAHEAGVTSYSGLRSWTFMNSFVYCLTLITTIGYGHIAPKTFYGRIATIIYAIVGIPLFLIVLADFGKLFTRIIKFFWSFIRRFYYTRSCRKVRRTAPVQEMMKGINTVYNVVRRPSQIFFEEDIEGAADGEKPPPVERKQSDAPPPLPPKPGVILVPENSTEPGTPAPSVFEIDDEFNLPISVAIVILIIYLIIGAVAYNIWESWNFFESFYFVFISMSTIGLGDLVPDHPMFMMASILYLVFGLALTSMCINVVQLKLSNTFKQASAKLGATIGLKVAEEDGSLVPLTPPPTEIAPVHKPKSEKVEEAKTGDSVEKNR